MLDLSHHALSITHLILWVAVFARQICLPVPANLFLLTAGALARGGGLNMRLVLCVGILGCLAGDLVWFEAGRHWGSQIMRILCAFSSDPHYCAQRADKVFGRWGLRSLILAKFIPGLDGVTPPLAGIEGSERGAFLAYDFLGSFLWTAMYAGLGYLFANRLTLIAASMDRFGAVLAANNRYTAGVLRCLAYRNHGAYAPPSPSTENNAFTSERKDQGGGTDCHHRSIGFRRGA
jgi:membrane protein DedA with SNARE-associated domain